MKKVTWSKAKIAQIQKQWTSVVVKHTLLQIDNTALLISKLCYVIYLLCYLWPEFINIQSRVQEGRAWGGVTLHRFYCCMLQLMQIQEISNKFLSLGSFAKKSKNKKNIKTLPFNLDFAQCNIIVILTKSLPITTYIETLHDL